MKLNQDAKSMLAMMALVGAVIVALNGVVAPGEGRDLFPWSLGLAAAALLFWLWMRRDARAEQDRGAPQAVEAAQAAASEAEALAKRREVRHDVQPPRAVSEGANAAPAQTEADDLTILWGIGPNYQRLLYEANIRAYEDLAAMSKEELEAVFPGRLPSYYAALPQQAELAAKGDWTGLKALQDKL